MNSFTPSYELPHVAVDQHVSVYGIAGRNVVIACCSQSALNCSLCRLYIEFSALKLSLTLSALGRTKKCKKSNVDAARPRGVLVYFCILKRCALCSLQHNGQSVFRILEILHQYVSLYLCTFDKLRGSLRSSRVRCLI